MDRFHLNWCGRWAGISRRGGKPYVRWRCWGWVIATFSSSRATSKLHAIIIRVLSLLGAVRFRVASLCTRGIFLPFLARTYILITSFLPRPKQRSGNESPHTDQARRSKNSESKHVHFVLPVHCCLRAHIFSVFSAVGSYGSHRCTVPNQARGYAEKCKQPRIRLRKGYCATSYADNTDVVVAVKPSN